MLRTLLVFAGIGALTTFLLPLQVVAVRLGLGARRRIPVVYHRAVCALLGVRIREIGRPSTDRPQLIVANHVSWLDIPVVTALAPVVFVAKRDVAAWPVLGLLARLQRTVFVDRARRHKTPEVNAEIAGRLAEGDPVVLFAEGTSSDGNRVLAFRSALLGAARDALAQNRAADRIWIQPLSIAYTALHGMPLGRLHRPIVAWYGTAELWPHLVGISRRGAVDVVVSWGEPMKFDENSDRKTVARRLEEEVRRLTVAALRGRPVPASVRSSREPCIPFSGKTG